MEAEAKKYPTPPAAQPRPADYFRAAFGDTATMAPAPLTFAPPPSLTFGASMRAATATMAPAPPTFAPPHTLTFGANMRVADAANPFHGGQGPAPRDGPENPRQHHDFENNTRLRACQVNRRRRQMMRAMNSTPSSRSTASPNFTLGRLTAALS